MSFRLSGDKFCPVCGHGSFLSVHRKCARRFQAARAAASQGQRFAVAGPASSAASGPAKFSRPVRVSSLAAVTRTGRVLAPTHDHAASSARVAARQAARSS